MAKGNFGERLKREREMREVSLAEVTAGTRIGPRFLDALENEEWEKLPGGVFSRGFVRSIARYLGLNEEDLLADYDHARGEQKIEASAPYQNQIPSPPKWIPALGLLAIILLGVGLFYGARSAWHLYAAHRAARAPASSSAGGAVSSSTKSSATSSAKGAPNVGVANKPPEKLELVLSTSVTTHIRILADNQVLLEGYVRPGDTHHFSAYEFQVFAANAPAVHLELNGKLITLQRELPGTSATMVLSSKDLRPDGVSKP